LNRPHSATVVWSRRIGPGITQQRFAQSTIARQSRAGQFVHLLPGAKHLFRRAFSVYATDAKAGTFDVLYQVLGEGTRCLAGLKTGATCDVLGPLGNTFTPPQRGQVPILVGGGLGMAPLRLWATELMNGKKAATSARPVMILGARNRALGTPPTGVNRLGIRPYWATDDGSRGHHGNVVELFDRLVRESTVDPNGVIVYSCGPEPMLRALAHSCAGHGIGCEVSLERSMPCGFGVCMGCVVTSSDQSGYETHRRVCRDGPVFDATSIVL
jgi:dihydroorotate dehydrogenase electron transfer subunit